MRRAFGLAITAAMLTTGVPALAATRGEIFDCHFAKAGHVIIDTREPGATITDKGRRFPAEAGSYFYQTEASDGPYVTFGPAMRWWDYGIAGGQRTRCKRAPNKR